MAFVNNIKITGILDPEDLIESSDLNKLPFFYINVSNHTANNLGLSPFEIVLLKNETSNNEKLVKCAPGVINITLKTNFEGIEISDLHAKYLNVEVGNYIVLESIFNSPAIDKVEIIDPNQQSNLEGGFKLELTSKLAELLKYSHIPSNFEIVYKKQNYKLQIIDAYKKYGVITPKTLFYFRDPLAYLSEKASHQLVYNHLTKILQWPIFYQKEFEDLKIKLPKGILLHGVPGCGKTYLLKQIIKNSKLKTFEIRGPELLNAQVGATEALIRKTFEAAKAAEPSIILIDQIDAIAPLRQKQVPGSKVVSQLLSSMDGIKSRGSVIVIATTNCVNNLDPALRRPGRFDYQIELLPPNETARRDLLKIFLEPIDKNLYDLDIEQLAHKTNGFVHADLSLLCNMAKLNLIERTKESLDPKATDPVEFILKMQDFEKALTSIKPSTLREYTTPTDNKSIKLSDVIGYKKVKQKLLKEITLPTKYSTLYKKYQINPVKGILIAGPPGTGKTLLAKALANQLNHNFISICGSELINKWVGKTESNIKELFEKARKAEPCIIYIDEIDSLLGGQRSEKAESFDISKIGTFLSHMDGISKDGLQVIVIGTTNKIELLDSALLRAGRFELKFEMGYPNHNELVDLYNFYFKDLVPSNFNWQPIVFKSLKNNLVGADIAAFKRIVISEKLESLNKDQLIKLEKEGFLLLKENQILDSLEYFLKSSKWEKQKNIIHGY